jgi:hypothetical protein
MFASGETMRIPIQIISLMGQTMQNMLMDSSTDSSSIPIPVVPSLQAMITYLGLVRFTLPKSNIAHLLFTSFQILIKSPETLTTDIVSQQMIIANFMFNEQVLHILTEKLACDLEGKSESEIRDILQIPDDLTSEEKKAIEEENKWLLSAYVPNM